MHVVASSSVVASAVASSRSVASAVASSSGNKSDDSDEAAEQVLILGEAIFSPVDAQGLMDKLQRRTWKCTESEVR